MRALQYYLLLALLAGISMGGVVFVPLSHWLIEHVGWRRAFGALRDYLPAIALIFVLTLAAALCISRLRVPGHARAHSPGTGGFSSV